MHHIILQDTLMLETHVQYLTEHVIDTHCVSLYAVISLYTVISLYADISL